VKVSIAALANAGEKPRRILIEAVGQAAYVLGIARRRDEPFLRTLRESQNP
jgi:hypothetical protein